MGQRMYTLHGVYLLLSHGSNRVREEERRKTSLPFRAVKNTVKYEIMMSLKWLLCFWLNFEEVLDMPQMNKGGKFIFGKSLIYQI